MLVYSWSGGCEGSLMRHLPPHKHNRRTPNPNPGLKRTNPELDRAAMQQKIIFDVCATGYQSSGLPLRRKT